MKCQNCGEEIPEGKIYCEACGTAIQMVPDYNPIEDIPIGEEEKEQEQRPVPVPEEAPRPPMWRRRRYQMALAGILLLGALAYRLCYRLILAPEEVMEEEPIVELLPEPEFDMEPGIYNYTLQLNITHEEQEQGTIYYTTDGTMPGTESKVFRQSLSLEEGTTTIRALFIRYDGLESQVAEGVYEVVFDYPEDPRFSVEAGDYPAPFTVKITAEPGCRIYYTTNGEEPDLHSAQYREPILVSAGLTVLQAVSVDEEGGMSGIMEAIYNVEENSPAALPVTPPEAAENP